MDMTERIAKAIKMSGKRKGEIAAECGVSPSAVTQWITGESKTLKPENVYALAKSTGFRAEWLVLGEGPERDVAPNVEEAPADRGHVPLISWVQAGNWMEAVEPYTITDAEAFLPCPAPHSEWTFALKVRGESMYNPHGTRSFKDGDIIYVDPERMPENGSLVVAKLVDEQEASFKQLIIEGRSRYLKALNPAWPEPFIAVGEDTIICGVVISKLELF